MRGFRKIFPVLLFSCRRGLRTRRPRLWRNHGQTDQRGRTRTGERTGTAHVDLRQVGLRLGTVRSEVARLDLAESVRHLPPGLSAGSRGTEVTQSARRRFWMCVRTRVHRRAKRLAPRTRRVLCAGSASRRRSWTRLSSPRPSSTTTTSPSASATSPAAMRAGISFSAGTDVSTHCAKNVSAEARGPRVKYGYATRQMPAQRIATVVPSSVRIRLPR